MTFFPLPLLKLISFQEKGKSNGYQVILPDAVTYTTLLKVGFVSIYFCLRNRDLVREGELASKTEFH